MATVILAVSSILFHDSRCDLISAPSVAGIRIALNAALAGTRPQPMLQCLSGNCTWAPFRSTAWCSKCTDIKDLIQVEGCDLSSAISGCIIGQTHYEQCEFTVPGGWSVLTQIELHGSWEPINRCKNNSMATLPRSLVWPLNYIPNDSYYIHMIYSTFDGIIDPLVTFGYVSLNFSSIKLHGKESIKEAITCSLTPCVKSTRYRWKITIPSSRLWRQTLDISCTCLLHILQLTTTFRYYKLHITQPPMSITGIAQCSPRVMFGMLPGSLGLKIYGSGLTLSILTPVAKW